MFSHTKFQPGINIRHITFFHCVQIEPHLSSLTTFFSLSRSVVERSKEKKIMAVAKLFASDTDAKKFKMRKKPKKHQK